MPNDTLDEIEARWKHALEGARGLKYIARMIDIVNDFYGLTEWLNEKYAANPEALAAIDEAQSIAVWWANAPAVVADRMAIADIRTLIEMVRARDKALHEIMGIARGAAAETLAAPGAPGWASVCAIAQIAKAALDTPPAQEQKR